MNKAQLIASRLLESFDKEDLEFWGGRDYVRRTLQHEGWAYRPPGEFTTWTVYRNVRLRNGNTVEVRVHPRRSHRAWFVSVWDPDNEHQHYWTVPNVHTDRVVDAAREVVATLENWRDDNLAHVPVGSQLAIALDHTFERYTRREEPRLSEGLGDDIDDLAGVESVMRDLRRLGWRIEDDPDTGPFRIWRAYKDFAWRNLEKNGHQWVAASLHPVYDAPGNDHDPGSYVIELHQERNTLPVAGISPFRVVRYAEWMNELFASTDYDPALSPVSNLDRTLGPMFAHMKAVTGQDVWESSDEFKADLDFWMGPPAIIRTLRGHGYQVYDTNAVFKTVETLDNKPLLVRVRGDHGGWQLTVESGETAQAARPTVYGKIDNIPPELIERMAADIPDILELTEAYLAGYGPEHAIPVALQSFTGILARYRHSQNLEQKVEESDDARDFVMASSWDSDPNVTLGRLGFSPVTKGSRDLVKIIPLKHTVPWYAEKYFHADTPAEVRAGMTEVGIKVGAAMDPYLSTTDPDRRYMITQAHYWPLDVKRAVTVGEVSHGWHQEHDVRGHHERTVYGSQKLGDLSTRLETVITALEHAIKQADNGTRYRDDYHFFNAVSRYWGRQPNRIVRPYTRKKKKRAPAAPAPAPEDVPEPPQRGG